jgi:hypothetical protein
MRLRRNGNERRGQEWKRCKCRKQCTAVEVGASIRFLLRSFLPSRSARTGCCNQFSIRPALTFLTDSKTPSAGMRNQCRQLLLLASHANTRHPGNVLAVVKAGHQGVRLPPVSSQAATRREKSHAYDRPTVRRSVKLTRFRGHPNICVQGAHDGEDETTLHT